MRTTFYEIIKDVYENHYEDIRRGNNAKLHIIEDLCYEQYDVNLRIVDAHTAMLTLVEPNIGELLMEVQIEASVLPNCTRFMYCVHYISWDFNHTVEYDNAEWRITNCVK